MIIAGCEYVVDVAGCDPSRLASKPALEALVNRIVDELRLNPVADMQWHVFGGGGGVTGLLMLSESHLALHTFPERGYASFNLYHCAAQPFWPWEERLKDALGAREVTVRRLTRGEFRQARHRVPDLRL